MDLFKVLEEVRSEEKEEKVTDIFALLEEIQKEEKEEGILKLKKFLVAIGALLVAGFLFMLFWNKVIFTSLWTNAPFLNYGQSILAVWAISFLKKKIFNFS